MDLKQEEDVQEWEKARVLRPRSCPFFLTLPSAHPAISSTSSASKESHPLPFLLAEAEPTGQVPPFAPPTLCPWLLPWALAQASENSQVFRHSFYCLIELETI